MSKLTKISLLLAVFLALDKGLGILRFILIGRLFGLSAEMDVFNAANNVPDLLFALISGGALAMAFIPVLSEVLTKDGKDGAWKLFSRIANLAFLVTAAAAVVVAIIAPVIVSSEIGIAPGFTPEQQALVVELMRMNLIGTLIFSLSGLVMAGLQANQHFLLPAMAPALYNIGQIFGITILAPSKGLTIGGLTLPACGLGVQGMVYGVIIGAFLHLAIQIPGLKKYQFRWSFGLGLNDVSVRKVLKLLGPRLLTMLSVQLIFIVRDNLASRLAEGSITALTYGWMIQQVPETIIGTAIGIALLPTLSEFVARDEKEQFKATIEKAERVLLGLMLPIAGILALGLGPVVSFAFNLDPQAADLLMWATRGFLVGLAGHSILEVANRSFYARQDAWTPLIGSTFNLVLYIVVGIVLFQILGVAGIALTDSLAFTTQAILMMTLLNRKLTNPVSIGSAVLKGILALVLGGGVTFLVLSVSEGLIPGVPASILAMLLGAGAALPIVWREVRLLIRL